MSSIHQPNTAVPRCVQLSPLEESTTSRTLADLFVSQVNGFHRESFPREWNSNVGNTDFSPAVDLFDTPTSYAIHVSLPGAKKEDIGVNYDEDKSEIRISGVVLRSGDEAFLKTLTLSERNVGVFEKKIKLGGRGHPAAAVDTDKITAKLDDGVLEVVIPKREAAVVETKKVQVN